MARPAKSETYSNLSKKSIVCVVDKHMQRRAEPNPNPNGNDRPTKTVRSRDTKGEVRSVSNEKHLFASIERNIRVNSILMASKTVYRQQRNRDLAMFENFLNLDRLRKKPFHSAFLIYTRYN